MSHRKIAVIDLGTNTFHLLIACLQDSGDFEVVVRKRIFVKLADEGIDQLGEASMQRGLGALELFREILQEHGIASNEVSAVGTAALRTASNGPAYLCEISSKTGIHIDIIDGLREAHLIYLGVRKIWSPARFPVIIMDIGGGSVEFIIADQTKILWANSYPIGVSVLFRRFHRADPISQAECRKLRKFLHHEIKDLITALERYEPIILIGASGTFDVLADLLHISPEQLYAEVTSEAVIPILDPLTKMSIAERNAHPQIPSSRVDMIVVAILLVQEIIHIGDFSHIGISRHALKEGLIAEQGGA